MMLKNQLVKDRKLVFKKTVVTSFLSRGAGFLNMALAAHLTIPYLGRDGFGIWMTVNSLFIISSILDFGIGNHLINKILERKDSRGDLDGLINAAIILVFIITLCALSLFSFANYFIGYHVKGVNTTVFCLVLAIYLFSSILMKIYIGLEQADKANLASFFSCLISSALLILCAHYKYGINELLFVTTGIQSAIPIIVLGPKIIRRHINIRKFIHDLKNNHKTISGSGYFLIMQVATMVGWNLDPLIIANSIGVGFVSDLNLTMRLYMVVSIPLALINAPMWVAYKNALINEDFNYIKKAIKYSLCINFIYSLVGVMAIYSLSGYLLDLWIGNSIKISSTIIFLAGIWTVIEATGNAFGMFLNGMSILKEQVPVVLIYTFTSIIGKVFLVNDFGLAGLLFANIFTYIVVHFFYYGYYYRYQIVDRMSLKS